MSLNSSSRSPQTIQNCSSPTPTTFGMFLSMYLDTVSGNLLSILTISSDSHLHTLLYFFLTNLSLADIGFTSTTTPKMLNNIHTHRKIISYVDCLIQLSLLNFFWMYGSLLLTTMAYDCCIRYIEPQNLSSVSEFLLLGLSEDPELEPLLFGLFLSMYLITVTGNLLIILAVTSDWYLHPPMYFFLSNLSLADIGFISTTVPKMLVNSQTQRKSITYVGCLTQVSFFNLFGSLNSLLLTTMAYDQFVAICHPLHYIVIMNPHPCGLLVLISFLISLLESQLHLSVVLPLSFCTDVEVPHFFCEAPQLLNLACSDTSTNTILLYCFGAIFGGVPVSGILCSYTQIVSSILRVLSSGGKYKAFSTCGSRLSVVCLFYGTGLGVYLSSAVSSSARKGTVASVMYTMVIPMLNPFIYSLRNRDIKRALQRILSRTT
ncbi:olfactory receptor 18-like [Elephas maximus indicus]|uniref:olfactory receptor 18-like n=1 Tax=Elephas maximus indicus TaxID=99487 RepID=UPI002115F9DA|nr:olfactory receptor 18-like [Elephas maximus indicus]